jgi:hypothetical protein
MCVEPVTSLTPTDAPRDPAAAAHAPNKCALVVTDSWAG